MPTPEQWDKYQQERFEEHYLQAALDLLFMDGIDEWKEVYMEAKRCKNSASTSPYDAGHHLCLAYMMAYGIELNRWLDRLNNHLSYFVTGPRAIDIRTHIDNALNDFTHHQYKDGWMPLEQAFRFYFQDNLEEDAHKYFGRQADLDNEIKRIGLQGLGL